MREQKIKIVCDVCLCRTLYITIDESPREQEWHEYRICNKLIEVCPCCQSLLDRVIWLGIANRGPIKEV